MPVIFATHLAIDYAKSRWTSDSTRHFLLDQAAHLSVLGVIWFIISGDVTSVWTSVQNILECGTSWKFFIVYSLMTMPASLLIERIFRKWSSDVPDYKGLPNAGNAQFLCSGLPDNSEICVSVLGHQVISGFPADRVRSAGDAVQFCHSYSGWTAVDTVMMKRSLVEASLSCCLDVRIDYSSRNNFLIIFAGIACSTYTAFFPYRGS